MIFSYKYGSCHYNLSSTGKLRKAFYDNKQVIPVVADFIYPITKSQTERTHLF